MTFATIFLTKCYKQCFDINMYIKTFHTLNTLVFFFIYIAYITLPCRLQFWEMSISNVKTCYNKMASAYIIHF